MLRVCASRACQRTQRQFSAAAAKASKKTQEQGTPTSTVHGAANSSGDSTLDKLLLVCGLGGVAWWWNMVPGPHNMH